MFTTFNHTFSKSRGAILGWGISMLALGAMIVPVYSTFADKGEAMEQFMQMFPPEMLAFFGGMADFTTLEGYLNIEYFSFVPIVLAMYAIIAGGGMIANDEENGTLDLIAAHPVSRSSLFFGRLASIMVNLTLILLLAWLGLFIPVQFMENVDLDMAAILTPFVSMFAYLSLIGAFTLFLSLSMPSKKLATMIAGIVMVADFFIQGFAELNADLAPLADILPLNFYQGRGWADGLNTEWFLGLMGAAAMFTLIAWWRYLRRDIRVGGEGSWMLPAWFPVKRKAHSPTPAVKAELN